MEWRPPEWEKQREQEHQRHVTEGYAGIDLLHYDRGFEAGADAMIQGLYQEIGSKKIWFDKADDGHILIYVGQEENESLLLRL